MAKPRKPRTRALRLVPPRGSRVYLPKSLAEDVRAELESLSREHAARLRPEDSRDLAELARVRVHQRTLGEVLNHEGPVVESRGARKQHPAIRALAALAAAERRLVVRLGITRPNVSMARQLHVAAEREALALHIHKTFAKYGAILGGYEEWAAARAISEQAALAYCAEMARRSGARAPAAMHEDGKQ